MKLSILKSAACALALMGALAPAALAQDEAETPWSISGTVSVTSDYRFRGVSQTLNDGALQAGVEIGHESGFYVGLWGSNVDYGPGDPNVEIDVYGGYVFSFNEDATTLDIGAVYYIYPNTAVDGDYAEFQATLTHTFENMFVTGGIWYAPDYANSDTDAFYVTGGIGATVLEWLTIYANVGNQSFDGGGDYTDWNVGATATWGIIAFDLKYVDTDIDFCGDVCDGAVVGTITLNL